MSRTEWILGIVLAALLIVVAYFAITFWLNPSEDDPVAAATEMASTRPAELVPVPTSAFVEETALFAFGIAQQQVFSWSNDAVLLSVKATFPYGSALENINDGRSSWTVTFYSPAKGAAQTVSVVSGAVNVVGERSMEAKPEPAGIGGWRLDSDEILTIFLQQGGEEFLEQNNVSTLTMALTTDNPTGRVEWLVSLFGDQTNRSLTLRMDAGSGEIFERIAAP